VGKCDLAVVSDWVKHLIRLEIEGSDIARPSHHRPPDEVRRLYEPRAHLSACLERQERRGELYLHLRHSGKKYNKRKGKNSGRGLIPNRVDIDQRPSVVAAKSRIGDWEADTIIGVHHRGAVMSHVERKSKYTKLAKLPDKSADSIVQACARVLLPLADRIETITYDNGKEFASHVEIATSLRSLSYFAKPYHSWERGLNEHTNGLFRQYFPKGSDLSIVSDTEVQRVEDKLNSRPRKILGPNSS
jgi:IS30 family transposase